MALWYGVLCVVVLCLTTRITSKTNADNNSPLQNLADDTDTAAPDSHEKRASWLDMKRDFAFNENADDKRASWLDMKRFYDPKRASFLDMKRASFLDMKRDGSKRASFLDMKRNSPEDWEKRASWLDMKRDSNDASDWSKRASWLDMKRASWLDMKRDALKRASWLDMKRDHAPDAMDKEQNRRELDALLDEFSHVYNRAVDKGKLDNEGLKLLREMLLRKELLSPSSLMKIESKLAEIKAYHNNHAPQ